MKKVKKCPRCESIRKVKNGFNRGEQRFLCKYCALNYTGTKNGYPDSVKRKALRYYFEGIDFRRTHLLLRTDLISVINWVKKSAKQIKERSTKKSTKIDVLELYEMCVN